MYFPHLLIYPRLNPVWCGGKTKSGFPVIGRITFFQSFICFRHRTFIRSAKRIENFAFELIAIVVKESADDCRFLMPPDRETDKDCVDFCKIDIDRLDSRTKRLIEMLLSATRLFIDPIDIF